MKEKFSRHKSLNDLLGIKSPEKTDFRSGLIVTVQKAYEKKLSDLTPSDLRIIVGQGFELDYVVPLAIEVLEKELFVDATYYEGDLLEFVLGITKQYWILNPTEWEKLEIVILKDFDTFMEESDNEKFYKKLIQSKNEFLKIFQK